MLVRDEDNLSGIEVASRDGVQLPARGERRTVELAGYVIRATKKIVDIKVVNLSYDGCAVHTTVPLSPGELVKLSVLGRSSTNAIVRWYYGRRAGLQFETERKSRVHWPRRAQRIDVQTHALLRRSSRNAFSVRVFDMTPSGCRCEFVDRPGVYERVWIKLEGLAPIEARVCWVEQSMAGLAYKNPLHPAVFEMLVDRVRLSVAEQPLA